MFENLDMDAHAEDAPSHSYNVNWSDRIGTASHVSA